MVNSSPSSPPLNGLLTTANHFMSTQAAIHDQENEQIVTAFATGDYSMAVARARQLIVRKPASELGWKVMGAVAFVTGHGTEAIDRMQRATRAAPGNSESHFNLGVILASLQQLSLAREAYESAIHCNPGYAEAHNNLGNTLRQLGHYRQSEEACRAALNLRPAYLKAHENLAKCLHDAGKVQESVQAYERALCIQPDYSAALNNLGVSLTDLCLYKRASQVFMHALLINPLFEEAHNNLGIVHFELGLHEESQIPYQNALALKPDYAEALNNLGNTQRVLKGPKRSAMLFRRALQVSPHYPEALNNLAITAFESGFHGLADGYYQRALVLKPDYAEAINNLGLSFYEAGDPLTAETMLRRALAIDPVYADALNNLGAALRALCRLDEAETMFRSALRLRTDYCDAHWNLGLLQLLLGDYENGWANYEWRLKMASHVPDPLLDLGPRPPSLSTLIDKQVMLVSEQGLGDTLQFYRFALLATSIGAKVLLVVQPELKGFLQRQSQTISVFHRGESLPCALPDYVAPLMSMPLLMDIRRTTIPLAKGYFKPESGAVKRWQALIVRGIRPKIGLVASGSVEHSEDRHRSMGWQQFEPILTLPFEFFCLQKELAPADQLFLKNKPQVRNLQAAIVDFEDTAAIVSLMDLVITVDTSVAHLAMALGKETWLLLSKIPDWRWLLGEDLSPWYDAARLYRQSVQGSWDGVMDHIVRDLLARFHDPASLHHSVKSEYPSSP